MKSHQLSFAPGEAARMLVAISVYTVMCREQKRSSLSTLVHGLLKSEATVQQILTQVFEGEDEDTQTKVQALCTVGYEHLESLGALRASGGGKKSKRLGLSHEERYRLAARIRHEVDALYKSMPSKKETYAALAEQSLELFEYELSAGQIEQKYRWIRDRPDPAW
jgi:hypothetical protein